MFAFGHVVEKQSFLFLLDLEIKRAQRYQNYLSLLSLTFNHLKLPISANPSISLKTLANLLMDDLRETDIVGQSGANRLLIMMPHADGSGAHKVRERLEQILQDYGFGAQGSAIEIMEACFPTDATSIGDLLRTIGNHVSLPGPLKRRWT